MPMFMENMFIRFMFVRLTKISDKKSETPFWCTRSYYTLFTYFIGGCFFHKLFIVWGNFLSLFWLLVSRYTIWDIHSVRGSVRMKRVSKILRNGKVYSVRTSKTVSMVLLDVNWDKGKKTPEQLSGFEIQNHAACYKADEIQSAQRINERKRSLFLSSRAVIKMDCFG